MALPPSKNTPPKDKAAQRVAAEQEVFLREVDEAVRQDELESFFSRYGKPLLTLIVLGLVAFGGYLYWNHRQAQQRERDAETFVQALDSVKTGKLDDARSKLQSLADEGSGGSAAAARLMLAGVALEQNRKGDALRLYGEVAKDEKAPQPLRDLAAIREVGANFDAMKPQDVVDRLKPYAAPGNPWFGVAGELVGMAYLKMGRNDQAAPLFAAIAKEAGVNPGLRSRSRQLAAVLGADPLEDVVDAKGEPFGKGGKAAAAEQNDDAIEATGE
ncbi:MAG TPA: tetratricopeptide repeat protein [Novosphingobium sp.]|nr:tetratricopeptide repeat protein [Novosphingobium sp.]